MAYGPTKNVIFPEESVSRKE